MNKLIVWQRDPFRLAFFVLAFILSFSNATSSWAKSEYTRNPEAVVSCKDVAAAIRKGDRLNRQAGISGHLFNPRSMRKGLLGEGVFRDYDPRPSDQASGKFNFKKWLFPAGADDIYNEAAHLKTLKDYYNFLTGIAPNQLRAMSRVIEDHMRRSGMTFWVKDNATGLKTLNVVPVQASFVYLSHQEFQLLKTQTGSYFKFLAELTRAYLSNPEGFENDPILNPFRNDPSKLELILALMHRETSNMHFLGPHMKDYPLFAISRGDDVLGYDSQGKTTKSYEVNAMTSSGLSNLREMMNGLKFLFPSIYKRFVEKYDRGTNFREIYKLIGSNTKAWVRNPDGTSLSDKNLGLLVTVGPGVDNGANPDIANISARSGLQQVRLRDCYVSRFDHTLRLNTGDPDASKHPIIRGIYNRSEPSHFFASDARAGFGIENADPKGEVYSFNKANYEAAMAQGKNPRIQLQTDANGNLHPSPWFYDKLGIDPRLTGFTDLADVPTDLVPTLADLVRDRKLYVSNVGVRNLPHIDDPMIEDQRPDHGMSDGKALFRLATELARAHGNNVIAPPQSYFKDKIADATAFLDNTVKRRPESFVIKATHLSSGEDVFILKDMNEAEREAAYAQYLAHPEFYEVQEYTLSKPIVGYYTNPQTGKTHKALLATDVGAFTLLDANGNFSIPDGFFLARVANYGSSKTNTGAGGGYYYILVEPEPGTQRSKNPIDTGDHIFEPTSLGLTHQKYLEIYALYLKKLANFDYSTLDVAIGGKTHFDTPALLRDLKRLSYTQRMLFSFVGIHFPDLESELHDLIPSIEAHEKMGHEKLAVYLRSFLQRLTSELRTKAGPLVADHFNIGLQTPPELIDSQIHQLIAKHLRSDNSFDVFEDLTSGQ